MLLISPVQHMDNILSGEEEVEASEAGYMQATIHKPKLHQPGAWGLL